MAGRELGRAVALTVLVASVAGCSALFPFSAPDAAAVVDSSDEPGLDAGGADADAADSGGGGCRAVSLAERSSVPMPGSALGVAASPSTACVAGGARGLFVFDVQGAAPQLAALVDLTPWPVMDVALLDSYAVLALADGGIAVVDVGDPHEAERVGAPLAGFGDAQGITISDDRAFVALGTEGLAVIDLEDPRQPILEATFDQNPLRVWDIAVVDDTLLLAADERGIAVASFVPGLAEPVVHLYDVDTDGVSRSVVALGDTYALVAEGDAGLTVVDRSFVEHRPISSMQPDPDCPVNDVAVSGAGTAVLACGARGLVSIGVADPAIPGQIEQLDLPVEAGRALAVEVAGDRAFVADLAGGLQVAAVEDLGVLSLQAGAATPGVALDVSASGDLVVAAHHLGGVVILGVQIPSTPQVLATALQSEHALAVDLSGSQVLVADGPRGLVVIDVSDPASPWSPGLIAAEDSAWDVASSGGLALVAEGETGLVVVDASVRPPVLLARLDLSGEARTVAAEGSLAFVGAGNGLYVVDITDPEAPYVHEPTDLRAPVLGVAVSGDRVLAALGDSGLRVIDVSQPDAPVVTDPVPGAALSVAVRGDLAWVAAGPVGVRVLDLSRRPPSVVGSADLGGSSVAVAPAGDVLWVADREGRVVAVDSPPCTPAE